MRVQWAISPKYLLEQTNAVFPDLKNFAISELHRQGHESSVIFLSTWARQKVIKCNKRQKIEHTRCKTQRAPVGNRGAILAQHVRLEQRSS